MEQAECQWALSLGPGPQQVPTTSRVFFDSCDGFFTNYNWREEHLQRMLGQAGERLADVYVGVDVFARGNVVGGRFDTDKVGGGLWARGPEACMPFLDPLFWAFRPHLYFKGKCRAADSSRSGGS